MSASANPPGSPAPAGTEPTVAADLAALGTLAAAWAAAPAGTKKAGRSKLPKDLQAVLTRLTAEDESQRYASAADVLADLARDGSDLPGNAASWDRFLQHVREQAVDTALRRSA